MQQQQWNPRGGKGKAKLAKDKRVNFFFQITFLTHFSYQKEPSHIKQDNSSWEAFAGYSNVCQVDKGSGIMVGLNVNFQLELDGDSEMMPVPSMEKWARRMFSVTLSSQVIQQWAVEQVLANNAEEQVQSHCPVSMVHSDSVPSS